MVGVLVHEWVERSGGAEKVLDEFVRCYPDADLTCLWNDAPNRFPDTVVTESALARTPLRRHKALALPAMPALWRRAAHPAARSEKYDFALVSSHLFAHHARFVPRVAPDRTFVYVHTPARYIWYPEYDARGRSLPVRAVAPVLRQLDRRRAREGALFAANSAFVRDRIERSWGVPARVIHPPVDTERITSVSRWSELLDEQDAATLASLPDGFVLGASRFVPYKRLDWVVRAAEYAGLPAVIAGSGPEADALRALADSVRVPVRILERPSDELLFALYQQCLVYAFPAIEDFGIMPVEARSAGATVVVNALGGASESIVDGVDGLHVHDDDWRAFGEAFERIGSVDGLRPHAPVDFSSARFRAEVRDWVGA